MWLVVSAVSGECDQWQVWLVVSVNGKVITAHVGRHCSHQMDDDEELVASVFFSVSD